jgi:endo-1,4-beta-D-glucanase Y
MRKVILLLGSIISTTLPAFSEAKFPFPQNVTYGYGIKPANVKSEDVQKCYDVFMQNYYEESGDLARIKWDNAALTVSEGIGYGMLGLVYMENSKNNTQSKFDKLWNYYKKFSNGNHLMNWKIDGFSGVIEANAATDAELDVGVALLMAYKQWGDERYLTDAKELINNIWKSEVNKNKYLKPGDAWDTKKNPSYFSTAAIKLFSAFDTDHDWATVFKNSNDLLKKCRNSTTGLVPDWCSETGENLGPDFYYDAVRTPWRIAWSYLWFGDEDSKDIAGKMGSWISKETGGDASKVVDGYKLDGQHRGSWNSVIYVGAFGCAGMVDPNLQDWCDETYSNLRGVTGKDTYFGKSLQLLTMLLMTGNMPCFGDTTAVLPSHNKTSINGVNIAASARNGLITINYSNAKSSNVKISLFDGSGRRIANVFNGYSSNQGNHTVTLDLNGRMATNGMILVRLETPQGNLVCKVTNLF